MNLDEIFGLAGSIVVLAMISVAIYNGDKTASIIKASGDAFSGSMKAATGAALGH